MKKLITILGISYCGSTYLNFVLGSLLNVKAVGESHWLLDSENISCATCTYKKKNCNFFTKETISLLKNSDKTKFYSSLFDILNTNIVVNSDKNPSNLKGKLKNVENYFIVLFKSPERQYLSLKTHKNDSGVSSHLDLTNKAYKNAIDFVKETNHEKVIYIDYDSFMLDKIRVLRYICSEFDLIYNENAINYWNFEHHSIGGNISAYFNFREKEKLPNLEKVSWYKNNHRNTNIDCRYKFALTAGELNEIRKHPYSILYVNMLKNFTNNIIKHEKRFN